MAEVRRQMIQESPKVLDEAAKKSFLTLGSSLLTVYTGALALFKFNETVSDKSTAMLMTCFYQLWRTEGKPPVFTLAEAQRELREQDNFRHPFFWAAFYMTGV